MKKSLFLTLALTCALAGFAQTPTVKDGYITKSQMKDLPNQKMERADLNVSSRPRHSVDNSVYYTIPGGLFTAWGVDGSGYIVSQVVLPPFVETTFKNMKTDKSKDVWMMNSSDLTSMEDENGDIVTTWNPMGMWYTFVLGSSNNNNTYQWNEDNYWVKSGSYGANDLSVISTYSMYGGDVLMLSATDMHGSRLSGKNYYRNTLSGWGFLSTDFLFGTGNANDESDPDYAYGFAQEYNALLAPLYIDELHVMGLTYNQSGPIPEGKSLKAYLMLVDTLENTTETLATFEALAGDTIDFVESSPNWGSSDGPNANKTAYFGTVVFRNTEKVADIFGNEQPLPAAIPAGSVWRIQFEGLNDEGVCLGVYGVVNSDVEASYIPQGTVLTEQGYAYSYRSHISPAIEILGQFESIDVVEKDFLNFESEADFPADKFNGWNVLRVSADGQTVSTDGLEGGDYDMGCAFVGTTIDWFDEGGSANYDIAVEDAPEWLTGIQVDTTYYNGNNIPGYNLVIPVCEPLPEGVTGRQCAVNIVGYADIPGNHQLIILQGDAQIDLGIKDVARQEGRKGDNRTYGLGGQRLSKPVAGQVFIKNGQKFIKK
ncbi:MAG: hypothetical protein J5637_03425 [Prevotella sp.]|nr:hypothetical protein [Prevotella sp.]MBO4658655.1 hypothetical protein [Prevotella sp.]